MVTLGRRSPKVENDHVYSGQVGRQHLQQCAVAPVCTTSPESGVDRGGCMRAQLKLAFLVCQCVTLPTPLRPDQKMVVDAMLQSGPGINAETKAEIQLQIANLQAIATCRCGASAQLTPRDRGFIANCSCGAEWSLDSRLGKRTGTGRFTISSKVPPTDEAHGAWHFEFAI